MKTYKSIILALIAVTATLSSCNDLELNESQYHTKEYQFSDFPQVKEVMTNVYGYLSGNFYSFQECATDDAVYAITPDAVKAYYDGSWSSTSTVDDCWGYFYTAIRSANYLIENCPEDFEDARWNENYNIFLTQLKNFPFEARALRAYFHMELLKRYKNIIIADRCFTKEEVNNLQPASYDEAVKWISDELAACAEKLPNTYSNTYYSEIGRVTKGFALAARARLLLYAASPLNNPEGTAAKYTNAALAALDAINTNATAKQYSIVSQVCNSEGRDLIFGIRESASNGFESLHYPVGYEGGNSGTCPSLNLVEAFDMADGTPFNYETNKDALLDPSQRDPRMAKDIFSNGDVFRDVIIESYVGGANGYPKANATPTSFYQRKFLQEATSLVTGSATSFVHIYPVFRYNEVYLNYAESLFEATQNPNFTGALGGKKFTISPRAAVNEIRKAYKMPELPAGITADEFRTRLRNERRVELCFEGQRYWDLRRWKIGNLTKEIYGLTITKNADETFKFEKVMVQKRYWDEKMNFYPFSEVELHKNSNLLQNEGW